MDYHHWVERLNCLNCFWWHFSPRHHSDCFLKKIMISINRPQIKIIKNDLLWAADTSQSITPPKEENCFWESKATLAKVPLETYPLPAACGEAGAPKYTLMFRLGDCVLAHLSLVVTDQFLQLETEQKRNIVTIQPYWNLMAQRFHKSYYLSVYEHKLLRDKEGRKTHKIVHKPHRRMRY